MQLTLKDVRIKCNRKVVEKTATSETFRTVPDGYELGDVVITINTDQAARYLAEKAMRNRTGRAKWGFAVAKVIKRKRFREPDGG